MPPPLKKLQFPKVSISHDLINKCLNNELDDDSIIYNNNHEKNSAKSYKNYNEISAIGINKYGKTLTDDQNRHKTS